MLFRKRRRANPRRFRPLAGFWFLNLVIEGGSAYVDGSFRPLAGFWFLNCEHENGKRFVLMVSVPLRGSGS